MTITEHDRPVYNLVCDDCGLIAEWEGMPARFDSRDGAASYAHDFGWEGLDNCPDCASRRREQATRAQSDREHHQAETAAAIRHAITEEPQR